MKAKLAMLVGLLIILTVSVTAVMTASIDPSGSYVVVDKAGQLYWTSGSATFKEAVSSTSPIGLSLDQEQKNNVNNRMSELLVRFAERSFKEHVLKNVLTKRMISSTSLLTVVMQNRFALFDANIGQAYDSGKVQLTQVTTNCNAGSVCFNAKMYGLNGAVIQTGTVTIFPPNTSNIVIVLGGDN